jgi:hypothetical protein
MRFEVPTAVKMSMVIFWVVAPIELYVSTNVSEDHTASIFRADHHHHHNIMIVNGV